MSFNHQITTPVQMDNTVLYTDANGLSNLKKQARENQDDALPEVARQFESVFISMMLKSMRQASLGDAMISSSAIDSYKEMYDQQMSIELSKGKGFGLAESIVKQLRQEKMATLDPDIDPDSLRLPARKQFYQLSSMNQQPISALIEKSVTSNELNQAKDGKSLPESSVNSQTRLASMTEEEQQIVFNSAQEFVDNLWPMAEKAAKKLGVKTEVLLSQAALETGWGQSIIKNAQTNSNNLFNIKADSRWQGEKISKFSLEYINDKAVNKNSYFRVYDNLQDSFDDYVNFIKNNPRYEKALEKVNNTEQYLHSIYQAGYATDPNYVEKIMKVMNNSNIKDKLSNNT